MNLTSSDIDLSDVTLIGYIKDDWLKKEQIFIENPAWKAGSCRLSQSKTLSSLRIFH